MSEEKKRKSERIKKGSSGRPVWILMIVLVLLILGLAIWRYLNNRESNENNSIENIIESNMDYNEKLQKLQEEIDKKEEEINKLNEEMMPLMDERIQLEQQLIELNGESTQIEETNE